ncbi:MAG: fructosamine kinase family protein [Chloroflexota bacterium]
MTLPTTLKTRLETLLNTQIIEMVSVSGGDISQAARIRLKTGEQCFVKWQVRPAPTMFEVEAKGLILLQSTKALQIPTVLAYSRSDDESPDFIAMTWLGRGTSKPHIDEALGHGLAALHQVTSHQYGLDYDNFIGATPQINNQETNWIDFFREHRLGFQMRLAKKNGRLPTQRERWLNSLLADLDKWLPPSPPVSLLHGDLWGGNWLVTDSGDPALIDPAVYYGDREAELAFTEMFGGFSARFYAAYSEAWPLDKNYQARKEIYNLYHLLNHLNLFGESYGHSVDAILRRFVN